MGATGSLSSAYDTYIPVDKIEGLDPEPADWTDDAGNVRSYERGEIIKTPIEVIYNARNNIYYLQNGNHRVKQAKLNGDMYIRAFVQPDKGKVGPIKQLSEHINKMKKLMGLLSD